MEGFWVTFAGMFTRWRYCVAYKTHSAKVKVTTWKFVTNTLKDFEKSWQEYSLGEDDASQHDLECHGQGHLELSITCVSSITKHFENSWQACWRGGGDMSLTRLREQMLRSKSRLGIVCNSCLFNHSYTMEGFWNKLAEMFTRWRQCVANRTKSAKIKVTSWNYP